jgi:hypothetical protein
MLLRFCVVLSFLSLINAQCGKSGAPIGLIHNGTPSEKGFWPWYIIFKSIKMYYFAKYLYDFFSGSLQSTMLQRINSFAEEF